MPPILHPLIHAIHPPPPISTIVNDALEVVDLFEWVSQSTALQSARQVAATASQHALTDQPSLAPSDSPVPVSLPGQEHPKMGARGRRRHKCWDAIPHQARTVSQATRLRDRFAGFVDAPGRRTLPRERPEPRRAAAVVVEDLERAAAALNARTAPLVPGCGVLVAAAGLLLKAEPSSDVIAEFFLGLAVLFAVGGFSFLATALSVYAGRRHVGLSPTVDDVASTRDGPVRKHAHARRGDWLAGIGLACLILGILFGTHVSFTTGRLLGRAQQRRMALSHRALVVDAPPGADDHGQTFTADHQHPQRTSHPDRDPAPGNSPDQDRRCSGSHTQAGSMNTTLLLGLLWSIMNSMPVVFQSSPRRELRPQISGNRSAMSL